MSLICALITFELQSILYWYGEHLANDLQSNQLADNPNRHESSWSWIGFPRRCLHSCTLNTDHFVLEIHKCWMLNVWCLSEWTLKILPIHEIVRLKIVVFVLTYSSSSRIFCMMYLCHLFRFLFLEEMAQTHFPWSIVYMKHNHFTTVHPISFSNIHPRLLLKLGLRYRYGYQVHSI